MENSGIREKKMVRSYQRIVGIIGLGGSMRIRNYVFVVVISGAIVGAAHGTSLASQQASEPSQLLTDARAGDAKAQFALGKVYEEGDGAQQDYKRAAEWYLKAAEQGNAQAQLNLGRMYSLGRGVDKNFIEALAWYKKAARQKNPTALFMVAATYYNGDGVPHSDVTAYCWFLLAQEAGSKEAEDGVRRLGSGLNVRERAEALEKIGELYDEGTDLPKSDDEAAKWYRRAAQDGSSKAQVRLAGMLLEGRGVDRNYNEASHWCDVAAKNQDMSAVFCEGVLRERGLGVEQDFKRAAKYYAVAANANISEAMLSLAHLYERGKGVHQDKINAYSWLVLATAYGDVNIKGRRENQSLIRPFFKALANTGDADNVATVTAKEEAESLAKDLNDDQVRRAMHVARQFMAARNQSLPLENR